MTPSIFDFDALNKEVEKLRKQQEDDTKDKYKWVEDYSKTTPPPPPPNPPAPEQEDQSYDYGCGYMDKYFIDAPEAILEYVFPDNEDEEDHRVYAYDGPIARVLS